MRRYALLMAVLASFLLPAGAWAQPVPGDFFITEFVSGSVVNIRGGGDVTAATRFATGLAGPSSMCQGPGGNLYVAETFEGEIIEITAGGDFTAATPFAFGFGSTIGLWCSPTEIIAADFGTGELFDITAGGDFSAATPFATGLGNVVALFRDSGGSLYASEHQGLGRVVDVTAGGDFALDPGLAFSTGNSVRGMTEFGGMLLVAEHFFGSGEVTDFSGGGDLTALPTFATTTDSENLLNVPGLGLFNSQNTSVIEISAGGDQTLAVPFATGIGMSLGYAGMVYVEGCSDGILQGSEECDDGNTTDGDGCDASCINEVCGNGVLQIGAGEECDDGNTVAGDGCDDACILEFCGDGTQQPSEGCDDGNTVDGDGCDAMCIPEVCGNGVLQTGAGEECDDSNTVNDDGCSSTCLIEFCGDGVVQASETCDDGNTVDGDGCSADCSTITFCAPAPNPSCIGAAKASLDINEKKAGKEKIKVSLKKLDAATTTVDFGDPVTGTTVYDVCIYDGADALVTTLLVDRAGDVCGPKAKDCWKAAKKGPKYKDQDAASAGMKKITGKSGDAGKGQVKASAGNKDNKGQTAMPTGLTAAMSGQTQATVQVHASDGQCFGATLTNVKKSDATRFKAKLP